MNRPPADTSNPNPSGTRIKDILETLASDLDAGLVLLVDGPAASVVGQAGGPPPSETVPPLLDAYVSSARRLASLVADVEFTSLAHRGDGATILLREVTDGWILILVLQDPAAAMPDRVESTVVELRRIMGLERMRNGSSGASSKIDPDWFAAVELELDRIFGEEG